ncbi:uncharacterized protein DS421_18g610850 [Arachis hypogaea]|nr:uncharacterized protein DS421_18g610850 [Arachis hypogaea]
MADSSTSSTSSTSQNASKPRKRSQFRAKIKVQKIEIVVRNLHQNNIKLYVKNLKRKRSKYTQRKFIKKTSNFSFLLRRSSLGFTVLLFLLLCHTVLSSTSFF